jgi:hypothetical protein
MFKQDSSSFAKLFVVMSEIYRQDFSQVTIEFYWRVLERFSIKDIEDAFYHYIQNPDVGKFLPKPADIIMAIDGSPQNQALLAWSKTFNGIKFVGGQSSVAFDDALIHVVVKDMNNWIKLCAVEDKQLPFVAKEFQERYRGYVNKNPLRYPKYLCGHIELYNSAFGYPYPSPVLIGNALKAKEVIATGVDQPLLEITTEKIDFKSLASLCLNKTKQIIQQT